MTTATTTTDLAPNLWTHEMIYKKSERSLQPLPPYNTPDLFTEAFAAELKRETRWDEINQRPTVPMELQEAVGKRERDCPICTSHRLPVLFRGKVTGIEMNYYVQCDCSFLIRFWYEWGQVPSRFRPVSLSNLAPQRDLAISEDRQAVIISALRANPTDSYLMIGKPNTGKTHLMIALYRAALTRSIVQQLAKNDVCRSVWRVNATLLMNQTVEWSLQHVKKFKDSKKEQVGTTKKIDLAVKHGYKPCLYLDELDKVAVTDFKLSGVCDIIDRVYEAEGQVVATMNKTAEELAAKWGTNEAGTILRRIGGGPEAHTVRFAG